MGYLLKEMELSPSPRFSKKELVFISPTKFESLTKKKILVYSRPAIDVNETIRYPRCPHGCSLTVINGNRYLEAVCFNHPEEEPVIVEEDDLCRYAVSLDMLVSQIRAANRIEGDLSRIAGGYFYVGHKTYNDNRVGFVYARGTGDDGAVKLSGLKRLCEEDDILVVLSPASMIDDVVLKKTLKHDRIVQVSLLDSMDYKTLELPIEDLISGMLKSKEKVQRPITELTDQQRRDYEKYEYLCYDRIHIPGTIPMRRSNLIVVNGNEIRLGDSLFVLLLRLIVELKKGNGGWVNIYDFEAEGIITDPMNYQIYSNLRVVVQGSLLGKDARNFIQSDGSKRYRISTHPDLIKINPEKLRDHQDRGVKLLTEGL